MVSRINSVAFDDAVLMSIYYPPQLPLLDTRREAEGTITTFEAGLFPLVDRDCRFQVSKSAEIVTIVFTSIESPHTELAMFWNR